MRRLPPLGSLRAFEAAARLESFKNAAAELGVTPTAISHQVRQLEEELGTPLFIRRTRKVVPTVAGRALAARLGGAFDIMAEAVAQARPRPGRRQATLSATLAFSSRLLVPRAGKFRSLYPGWDLRLHASDEAVDLIAGEADAAIRSGRGGERPGLVSLPLITEYFAPVCSPRIAPRQPEELRQATLIHFDWLFAKPTIQLPNWRTWAEAAGLGGFDTGAGLTFTDENSTIEAAVAGQGIALLSLALVAPELRSGVLVQPFGPLIEGLRFDFVYPEGAEGRPEVATLRDWILGEFGPEATSR
ncbi:LysR substrate-binding domain-containing protein [Ancylobacter oerskovii]|uniref:LysR substrate-binding domain-containing protein n=1 Tax=Ancylobacter oerskovii TaxID=459519 RepID=A0ABW4Z1P3_9HYPH|nr:LysR substrate-binding domain-containing protein [Ancylobacter oerskovii]MBS7542664.1 LysR family transcriptional regulator [Ancylobacter oerskovii]